MDILKDIPEKELEDFINSGGLLRHNIFKKDEETTKSEAQASAEPTTHSFTPEEIPVQPTVADDINTSTNSEPTIQSNQRTGYNSETTNEDRKQDISLASNVDNASPHPLVPTRAAGFDIKDPVELLFLLDEDIAAGRVVLHKWQIQFMLDFAKEEWTQELPFQAIVRACNGSGKDKYIVSSCVVWLCMAHLQARGVITSSSGIQLDNQTDTYITMLCNAANSKIAPGIWKCNYRYYECLPTGSPITLFATDEAGKAEGYHPLVFGAKMAMFESEAKTVPDEIHNAMSRCTGYTHRCLVSTPGLPMGHMYDLDSTALERKTLENWTNYTPSDYVRYLVTAYDCSHIPRSDIERGKRNLPGGETGAAFKSQYLAEYGTTDEMVVIPYTYVWRAFNSVSKNGWLSEPFNKAGLDLSDGGAETVLLVRNGNKHLKTIPFRFDNTEDTLDFLEEKFREYELTNIAALIFADCCGMGKPMLNALRRRGWNNIRYVDSRHRSSQPKVYANVGTELFFHTRILFERHEIILQRDDLLVRQLSTRYYKICPSGAHQLLTKLEQRSRGYPSPDRADAFNLAFWDYKSTRTDVIEESSKPFKSPVEPKPVSEFTLREYASRGTSFYDRNPSAGKDFSMLREDIEIMNKQRRELTQETK